MFNRHKQRSFYFLICCTLPEFLISILPSPLSVLLINFFHSNLPSFLIPRFLFFLCVCINFRQFQLSFLLFPHFSPLCCFFIPILVS